jgi:hypothetical protein
VTTARSATPWSNLPATTSPLRAVRYWRSRWPVEQGYQQMKEELGLDHFEGRSWHGFHRHALLVMLAYGFLTVERLRLQAEQEEQQEEAGRSAIAAPELKKKAPPRGERRSCRATAHLTGGAPRPATIPATGLPSELSLLSSACPPMN